LLPLELGAPGHGDAVPVFQTLLVREPG